MSVWVDSDLGFDDIWAVLLLRSSGVSIAGMSVCAGNAPLPVAVRNASAASELFGWEFPVFEGASCALAGSRVTAERILGPSGMRTRGRRLTAAAGAAVQKNANEALGRWLSSGTDRVVLALGPLTNIAAALISRPDLSDRIRRVYWMGGGTGGGNETEFAEFNAYSDPEALAELLNRQVPMTIADLDVCRKIRFAESDLEEVAGSAGPNASLLSDLAGGYLDIARRRHRMTMAIYDPVAAAMMLMPERFTFREAHVEAVLTGAQRGRTIVEFDPEPDLSNAVIATDPDQEFLRQACMDALISEAGRER